MPHFGDRPQSKKSHSHLRDKPVVPRKIGRGALNSGDVRRPGVQSTGEVRTTLVEKLQRNTRAAASGHLRRVREVFERRDGTKPPLNDGLVRQAYNSQRKRLMDRKITDEMTTAQLTAELMAKAVLFSPTVSDALKHRHTQRSKDEFAEWNDILGEISRSLPGQLQPGYKTGVADVLKAESLALGNQIGHSVEICGRDPKTGRDNILQDLLGVQGEVSAMNDLQTDPRLSVKVPEGSEFGTDDVELDREGIDMIVERPEDGKKIFIDAKSHGSYLRYISDLQGVRYVPEDSVGSYYFTEFHRRGAPHYLLNIDAFGEIPADGFHYTPQGRAQLLRTVHEMLDQ